MLLQRSYEAERLTDYHRELTKTLQAHRQVGHLKKFLEFDWFIYYLSRFPNPIQIAILEL